MSAVLLDNRVLVVGAGGGIGAATAEAFAKAGATVTTAGRPGTRLNDTAARVQSDAVSLDVLHDESVQRFFERSAPFHHIVVAAAATKSGSVDNLKPEDALASMNSKFWGAYRIARSARVIDGGSITFVSGFLSKRPSADAVLQGAINAALEALARGLALERAPVRVNTVSPGLIDTPLWRHMPDSKRSALFAHATSHLPVRCVGRPEDIAQAILCLASNRFATGTTLTIDGGASIA